MLDLLFLLGVVVFFPCLLVFVLLKKIFAKAAETFNLLALMAAVSSAMLAVTLFSVGPPEPNELFVSLVQVIAGLAPFGVPITVWLLLASVVTGVFSIREVARALRLGTSRTRIQ